MFAASLSPLNEASLTSLGQPYIQFQLQDGTTALLTTEYAREVADISTQRLTPMPNMPAPVLGLLNWRNLAIWAVDLSHLMDGSRIGNTMQQYHMIIVRSAETLIALAVSEIDGVARVQAEQIVSPVGITPSGVVPFLQGCILQDKNILLVLDALAIVQSFQAD